MGERLAARQAAMLARQPETRAERKIRRLKERAEAKERLAAAERERAEAKREKAEAAERLARAKAAARATRLTRTGLELPTVVSTRSRPSVDWERFQREWKRRIQRARDMRGDEPMERNLFPYEYPPCPHCKTEAVVRAGVARGKQRYRCCACNRTYGDGTAPVAKKARAELVCHRCTGIDCESRGPGGQGGRRALCRTCGRTFTQGGQDHLQATMAILRWRIDALDLPPEPAECLLAEASLEVLRGDAYTWSVELSRKRAFASLDGDQPYQEWTGASGAKEYRRRTEGESAASN